MEFAGNFWGSPYRTPKRTEPPDTAHSFGEYPIDPDPYGAFGQSSLSQASASSSNMGFPLSNHRNHLFHAPERVANAIHPGESLGAAFLSYEDCYPSVERDMESIQFLDLSLTSDSATDHESMAQPFVSNFPLYPMPHWQFLNTSSPYSPILHSPGPVYSGSDDTTEALPKQRCPHEDCGKVFKDLKSHMLTHQTARPEKCPIATCEYHIKGFARKYDKTRHALTHYKGTLVCGFCPGSGSAAEKSFNRADVFKRHLTAVHGVQQTHPETSKRLTTTRKSKSGAELKKLADCAPDATGQCPTCPKTFDDAQHLYYHLDDCVLERITNSEANHDPDKVNDERLKDLPEGAKGMNRRRLVNPPMLIAMLDVPKPETPPPRRKMVIKHNAPERRHRDSCPLVTRRLPDVVSRTAAQPHDENACSDRNNNCSALHTGRVLAYVVQERKLTQLAVGTPSQGLLPIRLLTGALISLRRSCASLFVTLTVDVPF